MKTKYIIHTYIHTYIHTDRQTDRQMTQLLLQIQNIYFNHLQSLWQLLWFLTILENQYLIGHDSKLFYENCNKTCKCSQKNKTFYFFYHILLFQFACFRVFYPRCSHFAPLKDKHLLKHSVSVTNLLKFFQKYFSIFQHLFVFAIQKISEFKRIQFRYLNKQLNRSFLRHQKFYYILLFPNSVLTIKSFLQLYMFSRCKYDLSMVYLCNSCFVRLTDLKKKHCLMIQLHDSECSHKFKKSKVHF